MKRTPTELAYVAAAVQNASPAGLVIILFDQLIKDLQGAIAAMQKNDVEERAAELKHGFLVLQQLQESLNMEAGGEAAQHFSSFYSAVRNSMLQAHLSISSEILQRQIQLLFEVRQAWQVVDGKAATETSNLPTPTRSVVPAQRAEEDDRTPANWNA